jgi:hypothetical protein
MDGYRVQRERDARDRGIPGHDRPAGHAEYPFDSEDGHGCSVAPGERHQHDYGEQPDEDQPWRGRQVNQSEPGSKKEKVEQKKCRDQEAVLFR